VADSGKLGEGTATENVGSSYKSPVGIGEAPIASRGNTVPSTPYQESETAHKPPRDEGPVSTPPQDAPFATGTSAASSNGSVNPSSVKTPGFQNPGSYLPAVARGAVTAVAAAASTLSETSLKPVLSYPFRRPPSGEATVLSPNPLNPSEGPNFTDPLEEPNPLNPLEAAQGTVLSFPFRRPSSSSGPEKAVSTQPPKPSNASNPPDPAKPPNSEAFSNFAYGFPFRRPSSSDGKETAGGSHAKPFWRRFSSGDEATSSGFDELFPEAEFGGASEPVDSSTPPPGGQKPVQKEGVGNDELEWLRAGAGNHVGGFDPGGAPPGVGRGLGEQGSKVLAIKQVFEVSRVQNGVSADQQKVSVSQGDIPGIKRGWSEKTGQVSEHFRVASGTGMSGGGHEDSLVPQLAAQRPSRSWSENWAPGSLLSTAGATVKNGALAPQELLSSVAGKSWPFGGTAFGPRQTRDETRRAEEKADPLREGDQVLTPPVSKSSWWGLKRADDLPPRKVASQGGARKAGEGDPRSDSSMIIYSSGEDSVESQAPSPQQLANLLGPGAEVLFLDRQPGGDLRIETGAKEAMRTGGVRNASSSEDDLEMDLGVMLGGGLYGSKHRGRGNETGMLEDRKETMQSGFQEEGQGSFGGASSALNSFGAEGSPRDLSFKHFLADPDNPEDPGINPGQTGYKPGPSARQSRHKTSSHPGQTQSKPSDQPELNLDDGVPLEDSGLDKGPLMHRTVSDAVRGAAAGESVVGVRNALERMASDSTAEPASPTAVTEGVRQSAMPFVRTSCFSPLHLKSSRLFQSINILLF
jgi:hypothetical protein